MGRFGYNSEVSTYSDQVRFGRCDKRTCASKRRLPQTPAQIKRSARLRSPSAPRYNFKRHFGLEFNNYLRSALPLRGVSSLSIRLGNEPRMTTLLQLNQHVRYRGARELA